MPPSLYNDSLIVKALQKPAYAAKVLRRKVQHRIQDGVRIRAQPGSSEIVNQLEVCAVGLRRSGNHAVINWIRHQYPGKTHRINDVPVNENPFRHQHEYFVDHYPQYAKEAERLRQEAWGRFSPKDCLIYNYEDQDLAQIFSRQFQQRRELYLGKSRTVYNLLILRDPLNLLASRFKKGGLFLRTRSTRKTIIDMWIAYAQEFLGETSLIPEPKICLNYNRWTQDLDYRRQLAIQMQLPFSDEGINEVSGRAGGSSFDGLSFQGSAATMELQSRWKHFAGDRQYRQQLDRDDVFDYCDRIFGPIEGTDQLRTHRSKKI